MVNVVVTEQVASNPVNLNVFQQTVDWFTKYWGYLIIFALFIIAVIVCILIYQKLKQVRKEIDEPSYALYKKTLYECQMQAKSWKIKKTYSLLNVFFLFLPIIWTEHSKRIYNMNGELIGYYRGECPSMSQNGGTYNYLAYKRKQYLIFEKPFIIKYPISIKFKDIQLNEITKQQETVIKEGNAKDFCMELPNGDIKIFCLGLDSVGTYYVCPVFVTKDLKFVDYRIAMEGVIEDSVHQKMLTNILDNSAEAMRSAIMTNPTILGQKVLDQRMAQETKQKKEIDAQR